MIALKNNLPVVRFDDGSIMNFERGWLLRSLRHAAERAGYEKWWLAEHVTASVVNYLANEFAHAVVTAEDLDHAVRSVLEAIGYGDIAETYRSCPPPVRVSLAEIARAAGTGYELVFFGLLRERLREVLVSSTEQLELCDLQPCVKLLHSARHWKRACSGLRDEIVEFVRREMDATGRSDGFSLQLR